MFIDFFRGRPRGGGQLYFTFPSAPDPLSQSVKSTLSYLKSCNPVGGTPVKHRLTCFHGPYAFAIAKHMTMSGPMQKTLNVLAPIGLEKILKVCTSLCPKRSVVEDASLVLQNIVGRLALLHVPNLLKTQQFCLRMHFWYLVAPGSLMTCPCFGGWSFLGQKMKFQFSSKDNTKYVVTVLEMSSTQRREVLSRGLTLGSLVLVMLLVACSSIAVNCENSGAKPETTSTPNNNIFRNKNF